MVILVKLHSFIIVTRFASKHALERISKAPPTYSDRCFRFSAETRMNTLSHLPLWHPMRDRMIVDSRLPAPWRIVWLFTTHVLKGSHLDGYAGASCWKQTVQQFQSVVTKHSEHGTSPSKSRRRRTSTGAKSWGGEVAGSVEPTSGWGGDDCDSLSSLV